MERDLYTHSNTVSPFKMCYSIARPYAYRFRLPPLLQIYRKLNAALHAASNSAPCSIISDQPSFYALVRAFFQGTAAWRQCHPLPSKKRLVVEILMLRKNEHPGPENMNCSRPKNLHHPFTPSFFEDFASILKSCSEYSHVPQPQFEIGVGIGREGRGTATVPLAIKQVISPIKIFESDFGKLFYFFE